MELFLNALWLALAMAAPLVWVSRRKGQLAPREIIAGLLALACIAILLFPVISATDDLRAVQVATEDSTGNKKLSDHPTAHPGLAGVVAGWTLTLMVSPYSVLVRQTVASYSYVTTPNICNRPPPANSAARAA